MAIGLALGLQNRCTVHIKFSADALRITGLVEMKGRRSSVVMGLNVPLRREGRAAETSTPMKHKLARSVDLWSKIEATKCKIS